MNAKLVDRKVVLIEDTLEWARYFETADRRVAVTKLNRRRNIFVSTVFLGLDHGYDRPLWFETMVFGTSIDQSQERYETWEEAVRGHARWVFRARQARWLPYYRPRPRDTKRWIRQMRRMMPKVTPEGGA